MAAPPYSVWLRKIHRLSDRRISLRVVIVLLAVILAVVAPVSYFSIQQVILHSEALDTQKEVARAAGLIDNELARLGKTGRDYAVWDDTYQFALNGNRNYIDANLTEEGLANLAVNLFCVIGNDGQMRVVKSLDLATGKANRPPFDLNELLRTYPALRQGGPGRDIREGIAVVGGQALLVSSHPIFTSRQEGPAAGALIVGIYLDKTGTSNLSALLQKGIRFRLPEQVGLPEIGEASRLANPAPRTVTRPLDEKTMLGYGVLPDLNGQPGLILQVSNPRPLYEQGRTISIQFLVSLALLSLMGAAVAYRLLASYRRARQGERRALEQFRAIFTQSCDAILLVDPRGKILDANPASLRMLRINPRAIQTACLSDIVDADPDLLQYGNGCSEHSGSTVSEYRCRLSDGSPIDLEVSISPIRHLKMRAYSVSLRDVTARKEALEALRLSEERYMLATRGANDGLWDWDIATDRMYYSSRWKSMLGYRDPEVSSSPNEWFDRVPPDERIQLRAKLDEYLNKRAEHFEFEHRILHQDGEYRWVLTRGVAVWNAAGFALRMAGSQTDITRRKKMEEQLRHDALHDMLTGLGNRTLMLDRLAHVNQRKQRKPETLFGVLFLDLDRFKAVNDTYGHRVGDQLLIEVSQRLKAGLRYVDTVVRVAGPETVVRIAGDEFVILIEDIRQMQDAEMVADRILSLLARPYYIDGHELSLTASLGIVVPETAYEQAEDMIRDADIAMVAAKQKGGGACVRFSQSMYDDAAKHMQLENELRQAIELGEFLLHYQPIYALSEDQVIGFEALARWQHPDRGLLLPKDFIHLAEETGLIVRIGYEVLAMACRQVRQWQERYDLAAHMIVSVNLSARQLTSPDLLARVAAILQDTGLDPKYLWLEITETTLIENLDAAQPVLIALRGMGIQIEIDDFGVGYSSLSYLQHLPIDGFKIDQSFINEIPGNGQQIVNTLIELGKNLKLMQIAEGVETQVQKEYLQKLSCEYAQGYLMAKPMSAERLESFLSDMAGRSHRGWNDPAYLQVAPCVLAA